MVGIILHGDELPRAYLSRQDGSKQSKETEKSILDFVPSKVAKHKKLQGGIKFVDKVPRLLSGKIQRKVVREWAKSDAAHVEKTVKARM